MAVLHHAFRCAVRPAIERDIRDLLHMWQAGDREKLSVLTKERYATLATRDDVHAASYLHPDGAAPSWMEPPFISPGLAAFILLAQNFSPLPTLSSSSDTNHDLLAKHLPRLGWSEAEVGFLIHGQPIEAMLQDYASATPKLFPGDFAHTGGWTHPDKIPSLRACLDGLRAEPPLSSDNAVLDAWRVLNERNALEDARAMLAGLQDDDWLVMSITH